MTALTTADLSSIERTYLGVLAVGLVSADLARDTRYRMELVSAVCHALMQELPAETYLDGDDTATAEFRAQVRAAMIDLDQKSVIGVGPPQDLVIMRPASERPGDGYGAIDINRHPPIFDRYLAQRCMEVLMDNDAVHRFLIELYADSSEVWHELYKQGYGQYR